MTSLSDRYLLAMRDRDNYQRERDEARKAAEVYQENWLASVAEVERLRTEMAPLPHGACYCSDCEETSHVPTASTKAVETVAAGILDDSNRWTKDPKTMSDTELLAIAKFYGGEAACSRMAGFTSRALGCQVRAYEAVDEYLLRKSRIATVTPGSEET